LGVVFFAGALYAWRRFGASRLPATLYFVLEAMHWGGPLSSTDSEPWGLLVYLLASSVLASAMLLHFALDMTGMRRRLPVYMPAAVMLAAFALVPLGDTGVLQAIVGLCLLLSSVVYPVAATVVILRATWTTPVRNTIVGWLLPVAVASVASVIPGVDIAGRGYEPLNVLYVAQIPLLLTVLTYRDRSSAGVV
jgi:hypothetical protein